MISIQLIACCNMFHHLFFNNIVTRTTNGLECLTALLSNCGGSLIKMGNKIKFLPTARERRKELLSILVTTFDLDWHLKHLCCRVVFVWQQFFIVFGYGNFGYLQWTLRIIWTHIHVYSLVIIMSMAEFLQIETVADLCPELNHCCSRVPDIRHCSRTQTLFQNPDTVPDSLMPDIGPKYLAYYCYYYYYYSVLCRKALLAIVYCTRSNKFFLLYWCNTNWHFLASYNNFSFQFMSFRDSFLNKNSWVDIALLLL